MFDKKKKLAVVIAMGKSKNGPEAPDPLEKPAPKAAIDDETTATPDEEAGESNLMEDIEAVGKKHGLDAEQSRAIAADLFGAMAECLRRDSTETDESETENYPA